MALIEVTVGGVATAVTNLLGGHQVRYDTPSLPINSLHAKGAHLDFFRAQSNRSLFKIKLGIRARLVARSESLEMQQSDHGTRLCFATNIISLLTEFMLQILSHTP
jgi:hypothetical protein